MKIKNNIIRIIILFISLLITQNYAFAILSPLQVQKLILSGKIKQANEELLKIIKYHPKNFYANYLYTKTSNKINNLKKPIYVNNKNNVSKIYKNFLKKNKLVDSKKNINSNFFSIKYFYKYMMIYITITLITIFSIYKIYSIYKKRIKIKKKICSMQIKFLTNLLNEILELRTEAKQSKNKELIEEIIDIENRLCYVIELLTTKRIILSNIQIKEFDFCIYKIKLKMKKIDTKNFKDNYEKERSNYYNYINHNSIKGQMQNIVNKTFFGKSLNCFAQKRINIIEEQYNIFDENNIYLECSNLEQYDNFDFDLDLDIDEIDELDWNDD